MYWLKLLLPLPYGRLKRCGGVKSLSNRRLRRLITATEKRRQLEFDYRIKETEHGEQVQRSELERVKLQETNKLQAHDREYQIAQLVLKKGQIQKQLETIGVVRTPHQGTIRRVKLVAQHGSLLRYEVSMIAVGYNYTRSNFAPRQ